MTTAAERATATPAERALATAVAHPRHRGPVVDSHVHLDLAHAELAAAICRTPGLPDRLVSLWDLAMPPRPFAVAAAPWPAAGPVCAYHVPDLSGLGTPEFATRLERELDAAAALGARGVKVWKNLGMRAVDARGRRVRVDAPELGVLWEGAARLGLPVAIHVGDPAPFFEPLDDRNERIEELRRHPHFWMGGPDAFTTLEQIHDEFEALVAGNPSTTFVALHFGCFLPFERLRAMLRRHPNLHVDTTTRTCDIGRDPYREPALAIFAEFPDRILFGTDLICTSAYELPEGARRFDVAARFYDHHWRIFETADDAIEVPFAFLPPWRLTGLDLDVEQLRRLYWDNAVQLIGGIAERGTAVA